MINKKMKFWFLSHVTLIHLIGICTFFFAVYTFNSHHHHHHRGKRKNNTEKTRSWLFSKISTSWCLLPRASFFLSLHPSTFCPLKIVFFSLLYSSRVSSTFSAASKPQKSHCRYYNSIALTRLLALY